LLNLSEYYSPHLDKRIKKGTYLIPTITKRKKIDRKWRMIKDVSGPEAKVQDLCFSRSVPLNLNYQCKVVRILSGRQK
jgi:hypothetical protein